jgi:hypothetical protein
MCRYSQLSLNLSRPRICTRPFDKLLAIVPNDSSREPDLTETDVLVHLLNVLGVERTPSTAHLEQEYSEGPEVD